MAKHPINIKDRFIIFPSALFGQKISEFSFQTPLLFRACLPPFPLQIAEQEELKIIRFNVLIGWQGLLGTIKGLDQMGRHNDEQLRLIFSKGTASKQGSEDGNVP
jgi:hypothetical protein